MRGAGLLWAKRFGGWPVRIARPRPRRGSAKAAGLAYEKALGEVLGGAVRGQWWRFEDSAGLGWCQTDLLIEGQREVIVLEVKLSWVEDAHLKLEHLYGPVVEAALGKSVRGIVACRRLTPECRRLAICGSLDEALEESRRGRRVVLQWLGSGHQVLKRAA